MHMNLLMPFFSNLSHLPSPTSTLSSYSFFRDIFNHISFLSKIMLATSTITSQRDCLLAAVVYHLAHALEEADEQQDVDDNFVTNFETTMNCKLALFDYKLILLLKLLLLSQF